MDKGLDKLNKELAAFLPLLSKEGGRTYRLGTPLEGVFLDLSRRYADRVDGYAHVESHGALSVSFMGKDDNEEWYLFKSCGEAPDLISEVFGMMEIKKRMEALNFEYSPGFRFSHAFSENVLLRYEFRNAVLWSFLEGPDFRTSREALKHKDKINGFVGDVLDHEIRRAEKNGAEYLAGLPESLRMALVERRGI